METTTVISQQSIGHWRRKLTHGGSILKISIPTTTKFAIMNDHAYRQNKNPKWAKFIINANNGQGIYVRNTQNSDRDQYDNSESHPMYSSTKGQNQLK